MPSRIYALAKELKIDSKELVNICTRAGITGKGSALASLDDEEVAKVKAFLASPPKKAAPAAPAAGPATSTPTPPESRPAPTPAAPAPSEQSPLTRDDYIARGGSTGKIKVIGSRPKSGDVKKDTPEGDAPRPKIKKKEPVINLARLPEVKQPSPPQKPEEPKPQKPDIRLPQDAIAGHKKGKRPPLEHLAKLEREKRDQDKPGPSRAQPAPAGDAPLAKGATRRRRGGAKAPAAEEGEGGSLAGMASARADRQKARRSRLRDRDGGTAVEDGQRGRRRRTLTRKGTNTAAPRKGKVALSLPCTVRSFSEAAGVPSAQVQRALMGMGAMVTINEQIDEEMVELLAAELGVELELRAPESLEESVISRIREQEDQPDELASRPPVVTFLGHVDHGKTSLLDRIIGIDVVSGEAGGITQHIRAYQIEKDGRAIAFVDTPGHEAFTEMRARGANVTDIAVLVIAADDGIMPQTEEAISHAKAANVPIVVALNKMDLPGANENKVLQQMTQYELTPSEWGGDIEVVRCSALTGQGMDDLLETLLGIAELNEYTANPSRQAYGACLEAEQESDRGVLAKLMVKNGTLRIGDVVVCGSAVGRIKAMYDTLQPRKLVKEAGPSTPVNVTGFDAPPEAGETFYVLEDIAQAREISEGRLERQRQQGLSTHTTRVSFEDFQQRLQQGNLARAGADDVVTLNLIIRADTRGSIEAIEKELGKLAHPEVRVHVLHKAVGGITVGDVTLASASQAVIIGFNVIPDEAARNLADDRQVQIRRYDIIYKVTEDIRATLEGKLKPEERTVELGQAIVKEIFTISRVGLVAGCYVIRGTIERGCRIRVNRDGRTIGDYPMESLRHNKDDVREVPRGMECGIKLSGFNDVKQNDVLEAYRIEEVARTL